MPREPRARRRRSGKVSRNQTREALQTKRFVLEPEISAEPGDFVQGKGAMFSSIEQKNKKFGFAQPERQGRSLQ